MRKLYYILGKIAENCFWASHLQETGTLRACNSSHRLVVTYRYASVPPSLRRRSPPSRLTHYLACTARRLSNTDKSKPRLPGQVMAEGNDHRQIFLCRSKHTGTNTNAVRRLEPRIRNVYYEQRRFIIRALWNFWRETVFQFLTLRSGHWTFTSRRLCDFALGAKTAKTSVFSDPNWFRFYKTRDCLLLKYEGNTWPKKNLGLQFYNQFQLAGLQIKMKLDVHILLASISSRMFIVAVMKK